MNRREEYMDFDMVLVPEDLDKVDEHLNYVDWKQRKIYLTGGIDEFVVDAVVRKILQYNSDDKGIETKREPIYLYITSRGGDVYAGFELIDVIAASKTPVYTINLGYQHSMGFLIGLAGHKRFAAKSSTFLLHDGAVQICDSTSKAQDQMKFMEKFDQKIKDYVISRSKISAREYNKKYKSEWCMFAAEAKDRGFTDYIIGEDCTLDEIL